MHSYYSDDAGIQGPEELVETVRHERHPRHVHCGPQQCKRANDAGRQARPGGLESGMFPA